MHITFDKTYIANSGYTVAMVVANAVQGDSRVIKTAATLSKLGFRVYLYGMSKTEQKESLPGYPFSVELAPNPIYKMKEEGWCNNTEGQRDIPLFIDMLAQNIALCMGGRQFDVLHSHDMYGLAVGSVLKEMALPQRAVWVHDVHEYVEGCTNLSEHIRVAMREVEHQHIREPDALTTVSPILAGILAQTYDLTEPDLVMNAPRLADFDPWYPKPLRRSLGLGHDVQLLVYNGGVKPERGVHYAVEALAHLPETHLALVTNTQGPYLLELQERAARIQATDRLHIHPYVPYSEVTSFLHGVNVGLNPVTVFGNQDLAFPTKLFEYIHSGTPVVSTATNALAGFLESNHCGMTYPEGDVPSLASAIRHVFEQYPAGLPTAAQGAELAVEYCWEAQEKVIAAVYERLLERMKRHPGKHQFLPKNGQTSCPSGPEDDMHRMPDREFHRDTDGTGRQEVHARLVHAFDYKGSGDRHVFAALREARIGQPLSDIRTYHCHAHPMMHAGVSHYPEGMDLVLLKAAGNPVYFHYHGPELRMASVCKSLSPYHDVIIQSTPGEQKPEAFEFTQAVFRDLVYSVCDDVFVDDPELQCHAPNALIVPRVLADESLPSQPWESDNPVPVIVHAPAYREGVWSQSLLQAFEQLRNEDLPFEFRLVEEATDGEILEAYRGADIIVDRQLTGWYGMTAMHGMAMGKAVVCHIQSALRHYLPWPAPLCAANPENIVAVLRHLLANPLEVKNYGKAAQIFVGKYHYASENARMLASIFSRPLRPVAHEAAIAQLDRLLSRCAHGGESAQSAGAERAYLQQAATLRKAGDLDGAEVMLRKVLDQQPEHLGALILQAKTASARNDWSAAITRWERVYSICEEKKLPVPGKAADTLEKARINQAAALRKAGDLDGAEVLLHQVLDQQPDHLGALMHWAEIASTRKNWSEALVRLERLLAVCEAGGLTVPKQAAVSLKTARLAQAGVFRKSVYYMRQLKYFARKNGWKSAIRQTMKKIRAF